MGKNQARIITLLTLTIFLFAFLISGRLWFRLDLTRDKIYTISEVSKNLYKEISGEVTITYFISERLMAIHPVPGQIADLLREYAAHSRGKIRFIQKDPAKAELLRQVEALGIIPQHIEVMEKNESTAAIVYSGITIEYLDREEVLPVAFSLETLEYDISSRIRSLVQGSTRDLGIIVGDAHKQWNAEYRLLNQELYFSGFKLRLFSPGEEIPDTLSALFVLGGAEDLDLYSLYLIDRYILGGGKVLFAVNGVFIDTSGSLEGRAVVDGSLLAMLAHYGAVIRRALVLDRAALTMTFQTQSNSGTFINSLRYPHWIDVQEANPDHVVTARFGGLDLYWASPLESSPPPGISAEVLFTSTQGAWLQVENFITNPNFISLFEEEGAATRGTKILGLSLRGIFPSAFEEYTEGVRRRPSRIIVVGNTDFAGALMQANRGEGRNLEFLIRAAEWLSGDDDIISIRNRNVSSQRLDRIIEREKRDAAMVFSRTLNTLVIPLAVALTGLIIVLRRRANTTKEKGHSGDL